MEKFSFEVEHFTGEKIECGECEASSWIVVGNRIRQLFPGVLWYKIFNQENGHTHEYNLNHPVK